MGCCNGTLLLVTSSCLLLLGHEVDGTNDDMVQHSDLSMLAAFTERRPAHTGPPTRASSRTCCARWCRRRWRGATKLHRQQDWGNQGFPSRLLLASQAFVGAPSRLPVVPAMRAKAGCLGPAAGRHNGG